MLERVQALAAIGSADPRMRTIHYDWLDAGERTQATVRLLSEQLSRFLDDQVWLENRRVMDILHSIEANALKVRQSRSVDLTTEMDATAPTIALPMERPLYTPTAKMAMNSSGVSAGVGEFDASALYEQFFVDPARLSQGRASSLQRQPQIGLAEVIAAQPLEQGLSELVTYLSLSDELFSVVFDEQATEQVHWAGPGRQLAGGHHPWVTFHQDPEQHVRLADHDQPVARPVRADLPLVVTTLMKGVIYRDTHENAWRHLLPLQTQVRDYVATMGLTVVVDEAEGYAFLRSRPEDRRRRRRHRRFRGWWRAGRCRSMSACCSRCSARSLPNSTRRAATPGWC